tara:strand:+ start:11 stop:529 length:519 start_codon:yes stop_codon:yes gene_type:complete
METPVIQYDEYSENVTENNADVNIKSSMLASINDLTYYNLACVLYYMFQKDIALLSKEKDIWLHKINTENNRWEIVDCSFIVNLIETNMYNEFNKLYTEYQNLSTEVNDPYDQSANKIAELMNNLAQYSLDIIHECKDFFFVEDQKAFFQYYLKSDNLLEITTILITKYLNT